MKPATHGTVLINGMTALLSWFSSDKHTIQDDRRPMCLCHRMTIPVHGIQTHATTFGAYTLPDRAKDLLPVYIMIDVETRELTRLVCSNFGRRDRRICQRKHGSQFGS